MADQGKEQGLSTRELHSLLLAGQAMSQEMDPERICRWVADVACSLLGASLAAVALAPERYNIPRAVYGKVGDSTISKPVAGDLSELAEVEWPTSQKPGIVATLCKADLPPGLIREGINHLVRVPVRTVQREFGDLMVGTGGPWAPRHQGQFILTTLANQAAIALENVRLRREADEQAQTLRGLIQASPLAIIARDRDARVQMWNPAAEQIFGWSEEEVLGHIYPLVPEEKADEFRANIDRALRGEALTGLETRRQKKDGTLIDVGIWTAPFGDGDAMVVIADITERKQAEEALRKSEERYRFLYENTPVMMHSIDHDGRLVSVNNYWLEVLGYERSEVIGRRSTDFLTEASRRYAAEVALPEFFKTGSARDVEYQIVKKNGEVIDVLLSAIADRDEAGEIRGTLAFIIDVTERKQAEEALRELAVIEERHRLARELHDSVTQSLYSATLMAEAGRRLAASGDFERVEQYLGRLGETSQQALKEMRLLVYELRPLELEREGLIGALRQRLDAVERRAGVETKLLFDEALKLPAHLEEELYRVAQEALNNALKHSAATLVTASLVANGECVELTVDDNGRGFDSDAARNSGGMGLVSIRERMEMLGGSLDICSAPGEGTRIKVSVAI